MKYELSNAKDCGGRPLDPVTDKSPIIDYCPGITPATRCQICDGDGILGATNNRRHCVLCNRIGFRGIDPTKPCLSRPGTGFKQAMLAARYEVGMSLWNPEDAVGDCE